MLAHQGGGLLQNSQLRHFIKYLNCNDNYLVMKYQLQLLLELFMSIANILHYYVKLRVWK